MTRQLTKRAQWFSMLAKLTSPMEATAAAQAFLAYAPMLEQFPNEAFTLASLEHVAANCRHGVPTYADLREHLGAWWKDNRPNVPAIGDAANLDENARMWLAYFRRREAEGFRVETGRPVSREHCLSLVKQQSLAAWQHLTGNATHARHPTPEEREHVRNLVANLTSELNGPPPPTPPARLEPRPLTREQLAEHYKRASIAGPKVAP